MSNKRKCLRLYPALLATLFAISACSPYASVSMGSAFSVGNVIVNPGISIGLPL